MSDNRPLTWYYWRPGAEDKWCTWLETDAPPLFALYDERPLHDIILKQIAKEC